MTQMPHNWRFRLFKDNELRMMRRALDRASAAEALVERLHNQREASDAHKLAEDLITEIDAEIERRKHGAEES